VTAQTDAAAPAISLVIPAHNEAQNIATVLRATRTVLAGIGDSYEIIVVDDASVDATGEVARLALGADAWRVRVLVHERQMGYAVTVCDGLRAARGDILAFMDGDRQFDPRELATLIEMLEGADMVAGYRLHRADPWHRSLVSGVYNLVVRLAFGLRFRDFDCGLKVFRREVFDAAQPLVARSAAFNPEIAFKARRAGLHIVQTPVSHYTRRAGRRSGARLKPILRAMRDIVRLRIAVNRESVSLTGRRFPPRGAPLPTHPRRTHDRSS
jgi:glycosyltransferase involved in cell wall biosynthesis